MFQGILIAETVLNITIRLIRHSLRKILRAGRATRAGVFPFCIYVAYTRARASLLRDLEVE